MGGQDSAPLNLSWGERGVVRRPGGLTEFSYPREPQSASSPQEHDLVSILDAPVERLRRPSDLVTAVVSFLGAGLLLLMAVYAHATTAGVAEDVKGFATLLATILFVPVTLLLGLITVVVPVGVLSELFFRRSGRQAVAALIAGLGGLTLCALATKLILTWGSDALIQSLSVPLDGRMVFTLPSNIAAVSGLLSAAGPRNRVRSVSWSWKLLWVTIGILLVTAQVSLPGVLVALLLGRTFGLVVRYFSGVQSSRAYGANLIAGIRRAGFEPRTLIRIPDVTDAPGNLRFAGQQDSLSEVTGPIDSATQALARLSESRVYAMTTVEGSRFDVMVLDGDRQVLGFLNRLWHSLRVRGFEQQSSLSLRSAAERAALLSMTADVSGVRTPRVVGIAEAQDSMLLIQEHIDGVVSLRDLPDALLSDDILRELWRSLRQAHSSGLAHRAITSDVILVRVDQGKPLVWISGWSFGEVAATELVRRIDLAQLAGLLALRVGPERTMTTAVEVLPAEDISAMGPLLQPVVLPQSTREAMRQDRKLLDGLRQALIERLPQAEVEPERLRRFDARTIIMTTLIVVAGVVIMTTLNFEQIVEAIRSAQPWWVAIAFALGLASWTGSGLALIAFSPTRLPWWKTFKVQAASSFVALAAPAGVGPAALNLRLLTRNGVATSLAIATVALVQVSQVIITVLLLLLLSLFTGNGQLINDLPAETITYVFIGVVALAVILAAIPQVRRWISAKVRPVIQQVWPRLIQVLGQPSRLILGFVGNVIQTMTYVLAFQACLAAFGQQLSLIQVAVIYLIGNTFGAAVPTPGGVGAVEFALITGLSGAGIPTAIATSVTILFRALTYWARIPIGWVAMRQLQRDGDI